MFSYVFPRQFEVKLYLKLQFHVSDFAKGLVYKIVRNGNRGSR
jgi:hypothetical protein